MSKSKKTTNSGASETKKTEENTPEKPQTHKETPKDKSKFVGFYRPSSSGPWTMFNQMLASEESIKHKIKFLKGKCNIHVEEIILPA